MRPNHEISFYPIKGLQCQHQDQCSSRQLAQMRRQTKRCKNNAVEVPNKTSSLVVLFSSPGTDQWRRSNLVWCHRTQTVRRHNNQMKGRCNFNKDKCPLQILSVKSDFAPWSVWAQLGIGPAYEFLALLVNPILTFCNQSTAKTMNIHLLWCWRFWMVDTLKMVLLIMK